METRARARFLLSQRQADIFIINHIRKPILYIYLVFTVLLVSQFYAITTNKAIICLHASRHHHHNFHNHHNHSRQSRSAPFGKQNNNSTFQQQQLPDNNNNFQNDQPQILEQCGACDEAKYELVFEGLWSSYTHPDDFPENYWLASFGDIIGASHSNEFHMWSQDSFASEGVRELAETGSTKKLESELKQESSKTRTIIKARELRYPTLNSRASAVFRTDRQHHLVSILSKLGPSPDWMVGVSSLELCQPDRSWVQQRVVNLFLWDAGTDSGSSFMASDQPTRPQERIRPYRKSTTSGQSSTSTPTMLFNVDSDSYDPSSAQASYQRRWSSSPLESPTGSGNGNGKPPLDQQQTKPFARLTITRQRVYEKPCSAPSYVQHSYEQTSSPSWTIEPTRAPIVADCRFTDWSDWSSCSSTCGHGIRTRTRAYVDIRALSMGCSQKDLIEKEICLSECTANGATCFTSDWSEWSRCSVNCGNGFRQRTRIPIGQGKNRKSCESIPLVQTEACFGDDCAKASSNEQQLPVAQNLCELTDWSDWSECSAFCGRGLKTRSRQYVRRDRIENCNAKLVEKKSCSGNRPDLCQQKQNAKETINTCTKPKDAGPCKGRYERWHYDYSQGMCLKFAFGGCLGNSNNFQTIQDCHHNPPQKSNPDLPVIDCKLSPWTAWSSCSAFCGHGWKIRSRSILVMPQNGGKPCDKKLISHNKCKNLPPCPANFIENPNSGGGASQAMFSSGSSRPRGNHNNNRNQQHLNRTNTRDRKFTTTTTTSSYGSMMDEEDDMKFARLRQHPAPSLPAELEAEAALSDGDHSFR